MNDRLIEILSEREDFTLSPSDKQSLDRFAEYLDRGSLFLFGFEPVPDPIFIFTNDAQRYRFRMSEIRDYIAQLSRGEAIDWERVPFEYREM
jgi:hypothetical protein